MTVFVLVHQLGGPPPAGDEVAEGAAQDDAEPQVDVVGHEDQHQTVTHQDLHAVQQRLQQVGRRQQASPAQGWSQGGVCRESVHLHVH